MIIKHSIYSPIDAQVGVTLDRSSHRVVRLDGASSFERCVRCPLCLILVVTHSSPFSFLHTSRLFPNFLSKLVLSMESKLVHDFFTDEAGKGASELIHLDPSSLQKAEELFNLYNGRLPNLRVVETFSPSPKSVNAPIRSLISFMQPFPSYMSFFFP